MIDDINIALFQIVAAPVDPSVWMLVFAGAAAKWLVFACVPVLAFVWFAGDRIARRAVVTVPLACAIVFAAAWLTGQIYAHPRPFVVGLSPNYLAKAANYSFPSDHASGALAIAFVLLRARGSQLARDAGVALLAAGCLVSWARVYLGAHYPFDIAGGALYGYLAAMIASAPFLARLVDRLTDGAQATLRLLPGARKVGLSPD